MNKSFRYISISHKTASVVQREYYHIYKEEKSSLAKLICNSFPDIVGLFLLATCNRTEIYFESAITSATALRDFFINLKITKSTKTSKRLFRYSNITVETVRHLLEVSSGLTSSVLGDAEIIHQIKKAHQFSIKHQLQGSLLERAMQSVFKSHKRISNETHFRDGTTSVAYKSLKVIRDVFGKVSVKSNKILFIGAGDIVKQLFKYNSKFNFNNIYISNRTPQKAKILSNIYQCKTYDWEKVIVNDFKGFDVIISAASNCPNLIKKVPHKKQKVLLIDLAVPNNIDKALAQNDNIIFYDLDLISKELENNKEKRFAAISMVDKIISEELSIYREWLGRAGLRALLSEYKTAVNQKVMVFFNTNTENEKIKIVTNHIMRKLMSQTKTLTSTSQMNVVISQQVSLFEKAQN